MGLDMYLNKKTYVKQWDHHSPEEKFVVTVKKGGKVHKPINSKRVSYIVEQVGYWRKFNSLHQWFVDNCQDGKDDCGEYYVDKTKLEELLVDLKRIKEVYDSGDDTVTDLCRELLPTTSGFFFGSIDYDHWYFKSVNETIVTLEEVMSEGEGDYYYQSSW
jgi:hypothetical protein